MCVSARYVHFVKLDTESYTLIVLEYYIDNIM